MTAYSNDFTAAVDINWLRDPVGLREIIDQCRPVPEPVLVGPPEKVAEVERLLAEKGIHGVRTVVSKCLDRVYTVPASLLDPPRLVKLDLMTPTEFDEFALTWRGIPFPKPRSLSVMRIDHGPNLSTEDGPFKLTARAHLFKQWTSEWNRDHARLMAPSQDSFDRIFRDAQVFEAYARIHNVYDDTHRNPWRKCRRELATILDPTWQHPRRRA